MVGMFDLSGKVALVTGANTGIGQGIALALAEAGADIAAAGRSPATETVEKARALGRKAENFGADLSNVAAVQPLVTPGHRYTLRRTMVRSNPKPGELSGSSMTAPG